MNRREFTTLLGSGAVAWPLAARAEQPAKIPRVGLQSTFSRGRFGFIEAKRLFSFLPAPYENHHHTSTSAVSARVRCTVACTVANTFLARCSASRARIAICASFFLRSVISRPIFDAPTILPKSTLRSRASRHHAILPEARTVIGGESFHFGWREAGSDHAHTRIDIVAAFA